MSPPITTLDLKDKAIFGVRPLEQINSQNIIKCKDCNKPVLESALDSHSSKFIIQTFYLLLLF